MYYARSRKTVIYSLSLHDALPISLDIATGWIAIVGLLVLLGWASRTLNVFDQRVLLAWALATPAMLFAAHQANRDRKSTRLNSSHVRISYAVVCLTKKMREIDEAD